MTKVALPSTIEALTFVPILFAFGIGCSFLNGIDVHSVWVTLCLMILQIMLLPCKRIHTAALVLEWQVFFECLAFEPIAMLLLCALNPLQEVFW